MVSDSTSILAESYPYECSPFLGRFASIWVLKVVQAFSVAAAVLANNGALLDDISIGAVDVLSVEIARVFDVRHLEISPKPRGSTKCAEKQTVRTRHLLIGERIWGGSTLYTTSSSGPKAS